MLNGIKKVKVLVQLTKCIVTSDQVIPAKIIIDMLEWPGSTIDNHVLASAHYYSRTYSVETYNHRAV